MVDAITARSQALLSELSSINQVNSQQQLPEDQIHSVHTSWRWIIFHEFRKNLSITVIIISSLLLWQSEIHLGFIYFIFSQEIWKEKCWSSHHQTAFRQWPKVLRAGQCSGVAVWCHQTSFWWTCCGSGCPGLRRRQKREPLNSVRPNSLKWSSSNML